MREADITIFVSQILYNLHPIYFHSFHLLLVIIMVISIWPLLIKVYSLKSMLPKSLSVLSKHELESEFIFALNNNEYSEGVGLGYNLII